MQVWKPVKETLQQQDAIGDSLALVCQVHPHKTTLVKSAEDFLQVPEGGCDLVCNEPMICGHNCKLTCHILNRDHLSSRCFENCNKLRYIFIKIIVILKLLFLGCYANLIQIMFVKRNVMKNVDHVHIL